MWNVFECSAVNEQNADTKIHLLVFMIFLITAANACIIDFQHCRPIGTLKENPWIQLAPWFLKQKFQNARNACSVWINILTKLQYCRTMSHTYCSFAFSLNCMNEIWWQKLLLRFNFVKELLPCFKGHLDSCFTVYWSADLAH